MTVVSRYWGSSRFRTAEWPTSEVDRREQMHHALVFDFTHVEGAEMNVLKSFPFDEVRVDFWFVETTGRRS